MDSVGHPLFAKVFAIFFFLPFFNFMVFPSKSLFEFFFENVNKKRWMETRLLFMLDHSDPVVLQSAELLFSGLTAEEMWVFLQLLCGVRSAGT